MNPESLMHEHGSVAVVAHKNKFTREQKDALRDSDLVALTGDHYVLLIDEEIETNDAIAEAAQPQVPADDGDEPTMADLDALTVAQLRDLADKERVDLSGLTLKADILGRMAAHFGLDPAS